MLHELTLDKPTCLVLAGAFQDNPRVDYAIDSVLEGRMGRAFADHPDQPTAFCIRTGLLWYFAGRADTPGGQAIMGAFPPYNLLMPSPPDWIAAAQELYKEELNPLPRYSFSAGKLSREHLMDTFDASLHREKVTPLDAALVERLSAQREEHLGFEEFGSAVCFLEHGMGFTALEGDHILGAAYSSLVCSRGIEVSVFVDQAYRQRGLGTALASCLLLESLRHGLRPNWDAANPESCRLALKLGYVFKASYDAYYYPAPDHS